MRTGDGFAKRTQSFELSDHAHSRAAQSEEAAASVESSNGKAGTGGRRAQLATEVIRGMVRAVDPEFIDENGGGPGVQLRKPPKQKR